jgi:hypothetical protein
MAALDTATLEDLRQRVSRGQRAAVLRTAALSFGIVAVAALFLWFTLRQVSDAQMQLASVESRITDAAAAQHEAEKGRSVAEAAKVAADKALADAEKSRSVAEAARADAEVRLKDAQASVAQLTDQVTALQSQIAALQEQLKGALDLDRHAYELDWRDLKMIAATSGDAYRILEVVSDLRQQQVHWGMSNTPDGGYNSPGFARLVWEKLDGRPAFNQLPRDRGGDPRPGDIVVYQSGYNMFFFRDYEQKPFVVGMTPFGVTALNYDFGVKAVAVLRTGLGR